MVARGLIGHLRGRAPTMAAVLAFAAVHAAVASAPPARTEAGVAELLGGALPGTVSPEDFVWEQSRGFAEDFALGRSLLFIAEVDGPSGQSRRDLFRARVRVTRAGQPFDVAAIHRLTDTPLGMEEQLVARGRYAAFVTRALGRVAAVTLLDLSGDPSPSVAAESRWPRVRRWVSWLETGDRRGIGRVEVTFDESPDSLRMELTDQDLVLALGSGEVPAAVRLEDGILRIGDEKAFGAEAHQVLRSRGGLADLASRGAEVLWHDRDVARGAYEWARGWEGSSELGRVGPGGSVSAVVKPPPFPGNFPPRTEEDSVHWELRQTPGMPEVAGAPPLAALATSTAELASPVDGAPVVLVAMDMRQLELRYVAGYESPHARLAAAGSGRGFSNGESSRVVAAFLGGTPRRWHRPYGAISEGRVLVLPEPGLPTIVVDRLGDAAFGVWPDGRDEWSELIALRQGRSLAADEGPDRVTSRVGLCADRGGHLIYAWARRATRAAMAQALSSIQCDHWLELGVDLDRAGFATRSARTDGGFDVQAVHPELPPPDEHFEDPSSTERFYLVVRDSEPSIPLPAEAVWSTDGGRQPAPAWIPAIHETTIENLGVSVTMHSFAPGHFEWKMSAGTKERRHRMGDEFQLGLQPRLAERLLASIRMSNGRRKRTRGLTIDGSTGHRFRGESGLLWVDGRRLKVGTSREGFEPGRGDATELPLTADHGEVTRVSRVLGARRMRAALCALPDGTVLLANAEFDSHEATTKTLLEAGCDIVVALDRGTHDDADMWRASGGAPPQLLGSSTTLHVLESPMDGKVVPLAP